MAGPPRHRPPRQPGTPPRKRRPPGIVALRSAAILAVYAAGYARTAVADRAATAADHPARGPRHGGRGGDERAPHGDARGRCPHRHPARGGPGRGGTYTGSGTRRHGSIGVAVTVQGGRITAAQITACGTRYPGSAIAALLGQVLARPGAARVPDAAGADDPGAAAVRARRPRGGALSSPGGSGSCRWSAPSSSATSRAARWPRSRGTRRGWPKSSARPARTPRSSSPGSCRPTRRRPRCGRAIRLATRPSWPRRASPASWRSGRSGRCRAACWSATWPRRGGGSRSSGDARPARGATRGRARAAR